MCLFFVNLNTMLLNTNTKYIAQVSQKPFTFSFAIRRMTYLQIRFPQFPIQPAVF